MAKLKVGLVGIGRGTAYGNLFAKNALTEVTAICDTNAQKLEQHGRDYGLSDGALFTKYEEFIESGCDIVVLGTPMPFHADQVVSAIEAGCHVLSEVTAASTL